MSPITTHILDISRGRPARGVGVLLERQADGRWLELGRGTTDDDGRVRDLLAQETKLEAGDYRLTFETGAYFSRESIATFYPSVTLTFSVTAPEEHYHVPLLLSPFGYSTYRGS
jgi:5-hydroxyisourate hydrolase